MDYDENEGPLKSGDGPDDQQTKRKRSSPLEGEDVVSVFKDCTNSCPVHCSTDQAKTLIKLQELMKEIRKENLTLRKELLQTKELLQAAEVRIQAYEVRFQAYELKIETMSNQLGDYVTSLLVAATIS
jgi:hypothetical protein